MSYQFLCKINKYGKTRFMYLCKSRFDITDGKINYEYINC